MAEEVQEPRLRAPRVLLAVTGSVAAIKAAPLAAALRRGVRAVAAGGGSGETESSAMSDGGKKASAAAGTTPAAAAGGGGGGGGAGGGVGDGSTLEKDALPQAEVRVAFTERGLHFAQSTAAGEQRERFLEADEQPPPPASSGGEGADAAVASSVLPVGVEGFCDADEWAWDARGDAVLHIELRKWADVLVVAPLDANTLAKLAGGLCDNLVTCVARAWEWGHPQAPLLVAPAMNTLMWEHPLTAEHLDTVRRLGGTVIPPVPKTLVCGDVGNGAMAEVDTIVAAVQEAVRQAAEASNAGTNKRRE